MNIGNIGSKGIIGSAKKIVEGDLPQFKKHVPQLSGKQKIALSLVALAGLGMSLVKATQKGKVEQQEKDLEKALDSLNKQDHTKELKDAINHIDKLKDPKINVDLKESMKKVQEADKIYFSMRYELTKAGLKIDELLKKEGGNELLTQMAKNVKNGEDTSKIIDELKNLK